MTKKRLVLCNGQELPADDPDVKDRHVVKLATQGRAKNVNVKIEDVARTFMRHLTPRQVDLLEISAFVYAADTATNRGKEWKGVVEPWGRDFRYVVPVRDLEFWTRPDVDDALRQALDWVTGDKHTFEFRPYTLKDIRQEFIDLTNEEDWSFTGVDRVIMFSGGLDSLAGAIESATDGKNLVLVSHRSVNLIDKRQRRLVDSLLKTVDVQARHIPVWVNKDQDLRGESTQRSRSFLFAALGAVVAESIGAGGVRFYENGVVSLNLPVADEVLGSRASRTTHPLTLDNFTSFYKLFTERDFVVDNPYLSKTKTDVVKVIADNGCAELISQTVSCAHTMFKSTSQQHCGTCSQCIDRRVAVIEAGLEAADPETDYEVDVFTGPRGQGYDQNMAVNYVRHANELRLMDERSFAFKFNRELGRATRHAPKRRQLTEQLAELHMRHGQIVHRVLARKISEHAGLMASGELEPTSMLGLIHNRKQMQPAWRRFAERIVGSLKRGLPAACQSNPPATEPALQEVCDGLLRAADVDLQREFPYMKWSLASTKPDWSRDDLDLWVELKYVRKKGQDKGISGDIAEDITKYGDNGRRVLFIVYDPKRLIIDDEKFCEPVIKRPDMTISIIR